MKALVPLNQIEIDTQRVLKIQRDELLLILNQQFELNQYADHIVQAQTACLQGVHPELIQQLSQTIEQIIQALTKSKKTLQTKKFNILQKWLGIDLEFSANQVKFYQELEHLLAKAKQLSQRLLIEMKRAETYLAKLGRYREDMAHYVVAAEQFLAEYPKFVKDQHPLDSFKERLDKKVMTLKTLQTHHDMVMLQMQLSNQVTLTLIDRFNEAQQVLIPAWQYSVQKSYIQPNQKQLSALDLEKIDRMRSDLIVILKKSL